MKKLATALLLILMSNHILSQNIWNPPDHGSSKAIHGKSRTATKSELARPVVKLPPKLKLLRSNPHRFTAIRLADSDPWFTPDDEDMAVSRNRITVIKSRNWDQDLDISDYAKARLWLARQLALKKYLETHGSAV